MIPKWGATGIGVFAVVWMLAPTAYVAPTSKPQITVAGVRAYEGTGQMGRQVMFAIKLSPPSTKQLQVRVATKDGTARAGQDYIAVNKTLSVASRAGQTTVGVTIVTDAVPEPDETFTIVASAAGYTSSVPTAICTLINDDRYPNPTATPRPTATPVPLPTVTPAPTSTPVPSGTASIRMVAYEDNWADARERWLDIGSKFVGPPDAVNTFNDWISSGQPNGKFDYATRAAGVVLTYQRAPGVPYFVGHISARGLKPNFAYQLKLAGKPVSGSRGTGKNQSYVLATDKTRAGAPSVRLVHGADGQATPINGDDWTNQQLGYIGRWWNDSNASRNTNAITDAAYVANTKDTIYGYQFIGDFVTDSKGNAETDVKGNRSYHITWQDWQDGPKHVFFGNFAIRGFMSSSIPPYYYGYGRYAPATGDVAHGQNGLARIGLWYELEAGRPNPVILPSGTYYCRMLVTEETFHNPGNPLGGVWKTVMATEDRDVATGLPDTSASNDIVFTIR